MANHPNRSKSSSSEGKNPTPADVLAARNKAGLTQTEAGELVYSSRRAWTNWESLDPVEQRRMHPAIFELFLAKTGQKPASWYSGLAATRDGSAARAAAGSKPR